MTVLAAGETVVFSHKRHAPLKMDCVACHATAAVAERAGFPAAVKCLACHPEKADALRSPFPSRRVYKLADFVIFSHARHIAAGTNCQTCHGPVQERDLLRAEVSHSMKACMGCHKVRRASLTCTACHELSQ